VQQALQGLPWVDEKSVQADHSTQQARFKVKDKSKFSLEEINQALPKRFRPAKVISGPG
jgi:hypothetical protein